MIPLQDVNTPPKRGIAWMMWLIVFANVAVFIFELTLTSYKATCFSYAYSFDPAALNGHVSVPSAYLESHCQGSGYTPISPILTIFTAMFLHAGLIHIAGNMLFLMVFGDNVEDRFGHLGFLIFYLICGIAAAITQSFASQFMDVPNLGASGAIAGVLGSYLILFPRARVRTLFILGIIPIFASVPAVLLILVWFGLQLLSGYFTLAPAAGQAADPGVAYFAHIGGFVVGLLITLFMRQQLLKGVRYTSSR
jgi:membrane associated rhomboid family serine protease